MNRHTDKMNGGKTTGQLVDKLNTQTYRMGVTSLFTTPTNSLTSEVALVFLDLVYVLMKTAAVRLVISHLAPVLKTTK